MERKKRGITKKQARRRRIISKFLLLTIILVSIYFLIFKSSIFNLKNFEVSGNKKISKYEIIDKSKYKEGFKIFNVKKKEAIESIKTIPYIEDADVKISLPNKIKISVVERKPIGALETGKAYKLIDKDGVALEEVGSIEKLKLPLIKGIGSKDMKDSKKLFKGDEGKEQLKFLNIIIESKTIDKFKILDLTDITNFKAELFTGEKVYFGNNISLDYKLDFLDKIIKDTNKKKMKVKKIEFNKGDNPVVIVDDKDIEEEKENDLKDKEDDIKNKDQPNKEEQ